MADLAEYAADTARRARLAARQLSIADTKTKNDWLRRAATLLVDSKQLVAEANARDLAAAEGFGLTSAQVDRLTLTDGRIEAIAAAIEEIADLPDPVGRVLSQLERPNGLRIEKVAVPLGVVFFIYESRPNVTADAAALCVKSGNAVILRGGKEAFHSNQAIHGILAEALEQSGLPHDAVQLVNTTDRSAVGEFLSLGSEIDLTIPRGGKGLIERVAKEAAMPVLKHFDGICHVFVDAAADLDIAEEVTFNSKVQRPGVCNAAETLLVHRDVAASFLPMMESRFSQSHVRLKGCSRTREIIKCEAADESSYATEWLDLVMSVKVVESVADAIDHIEQYGSRHTDTIITNDTATAETFTSRVDTAAVMVNASTRFNDGGVFGLGAEIGISTDKFHARGPCGLAELTSYKYIVRGEGQIRE